MVRLTGIVAAPAKPAAALLMCLLWGCASDKPPEEPTKFDTELPPGAPALVRADPSEYPDFRLLWSNDRGIGAAIDESIAYFKKPSSQAWFPYTRLADGEVTHARQVETLETLKAIYAKARDAEQFKTMVIGAFDIYKSVGYDAKSGKMLFTGYYTPIFDGSLVRTERFKYPLYKRPADLVTDPKTGEPKGRATAGGGTEPYPTRAEIERSGMLKGLELVYLADPFEVYIIQVQGSARIRLVDGKEMNVGYHGKTDRAYNSPGKALIESGKLKKDELSLARLKRYFRDHPAELEVLNVNESYVFFQEGPPGPFGSIGTKVTPWHTVATDKSVFPRGGPTVAVTSVPESGGGDALRSRPHTGLYLDQDTGGAIRSAGRADLYIGVGPEAERIAGYVQNEGKLFYLFAKPGGYRP
jgi:membrane-bound lytic murein transglycosylase A